MKLSEVLLVLETKVPVSWQEDYDNSGLCVGNTEMEIKGILLCIDVTPEIIGEARRIKANLIISHHPLIFKPLKKITGKNSVENTILEAIRENIAIYCMHTNIDNISEGVNLKICQKLNLKSTAILQPMSNQLKKLVTFVPLSHADNVRTALFDVGAGHIGNYDSCSFNAQGKGSFRALEGTSPYTGEIGKLHFEEEIRLETVFPGVIKNQVIKALLEAHPYEEVAYDIFPIENVYEKAGAGMIGELAKSMAGIEFLKKVKEIFKCPVIRHSQLSSKPVKKIAVCGGSGSFLIKQAIAAKADIFITGDIKYHQFFDADDNIVLADIGHYESEQFTIEIFYDILIKNFPNFAIHFSNIHSSPIYYL